MPRPFVQTVESRWKGATLAAWTASPCAAPASGSSAATADAQGAFLAGDFDSDGASDVVTPVKRDDGLHMVAGLHRTYDYAVVDVTDKADASGDHVTVRPRGARYTVPGSDVDYYFGADTIVVTPCAGTPTAYIWNGAGFDAQTLAK